MEINKLDVIQQALNEVITDKNVHQNYIQIVQKSTVIADTLYYNRSDSNKFSTYALAKFPDITEVQIMEIRTIILNQVQQDNQASAAAAVATVTQPQLNGFSQEHFNVGLQGAMASLLNVLRITMEPELLDHAQFYRKKLCEDYRIQDFFLAEFLPSLRVISAEDLAAIKKCRLSWGSNDSEDNWQHPVLMEIMQLFQEPHKRTSNKSEIRKEHKRTRRCITHMELANGLFANLYRKPTLDTLKPDFTLFVDENDITGKSMKTFVELTVKDPIDDSHLGKAIQYNERIFKLQPDRVMVTSVVTNLDKVIFIQSLRSSRPNGSGVSSTGFLTRPLNFNDKVAYLDALVNGPRDHTGFEPLEVSIDDGELRFKAGKALGGGSTSRCFIANDGETVLKKFFNQDDMFTELRVYQHMVQFDETKRSHLMSLVGVDVQNRVMVLKGVGKPLDKAHCRSSAFVRWAIKCLRDLQEMRIVHRDITRRHFVQRATNGSIMLIDLGSAAVVDNDEEVLYRGTAYLAADEVLEAMIERRAYRPKYRHDWESLVKLLLIENGYGTYAVLRSIDHSQPGGFDRILKHWRREIQYLSDENSYKKLLLLCRNDATTLDGLLEKFIELRVFDCLPPHSKISPMSNSGALISASAPLPDSAPHI